MQARASRLVGLDGRPGYCPPATLGEHLDRITIDRTTDCSIVLDTSLAGQLQSRARGASSISRRQMLTPLMSRRKERCLFLLPRFIKKPVETTRLIRIATSHTSCAARLRPVPVSRLAIGPRSRSMHVGGASNTVAEPAARPAADCGRTGADAARRTTGGCAEVSLSGCAGALQRCGASGAFADSEARSGGVARTNEHKKDRLRMISAR